MAAPSPATGQMVQSAEQPIPPRRRERRCIPAPGCHHEGAPSYTSWAALRARCSSASWPSVPARHSSARSCRSPSKRRRSRRSRGRSSTGASPRRSWSRRNLRPAARAASMRARPEASPTCEMTRQACPMRSRCRSAGPGARRATANRLVGVSAWRGPGRQPRRRGQRPRTRRRPASSAAMRSGGNEARRSTKSERSTFCTS